jgi:hypothetical protein
MWRTSSVLYRSRVGKRCRLHPTSSRTKSQLRSSLGFLGFNDLYQGNPEAAIEHQSRAMRLSPFDPRRGHREACIAYAHLIAGRYGEAASWAQAAIRNQPHFLAGHRVAAATNALAGRMDEARAAISALREADPTFRLSNIWTRIPLRRPEDRARLEEGLRKAGLPE